MRNARPQNVEWTETLESDADLALVVAALGGGPGLPTEPDDGGRATRDADGAGGADPDTA